MSIDKDMLAEIAKQHRQYKRLANNARASLVDATKQALLVGTLIEKAQRHHKHNIHGYLSPVMSGIESRAYMTAQRVSKTRDIANDKRVLQKLTILRQAPARKRVAKAKPSLTTKIANAHTSITSALKKRGVDDMTAQEKALAVEAMKPLAELYVRLSSK